MYWARTALISWNRGYWDIEISKNKWSISSYCDSRCLTGPKDENDGKRRIKQVSVGYTVLWKPSCQAA